MTLRLLVHVPAKPSDLIRGWDPVRQGEPLFTDKEMRQYDNLRRFPVILNHREAS
jgi:hypothetical protein